MIVAIVIAYAAFVAGAVALRCIRGLRAIEHAREGRARVRRIRDAGFAPDIRVVLLLPMLREQSQVAALLAHLDRLEFPPERLTLVPITSAVETAQNAEMAAAAARIVADLRRGERGIAFLWRHSAYYSTARLSELARMDPGEAERSLAADASKPGTADVLRTLLARITCRAAVVPLHYPHVRGNKASQMNYALDTLRERGAFDDPERTYVGVYDADSRPHPLALVSLAVAAAEERAPAFQQYPIYLDGTARTTSLMENEAWLQSARSVCVEYAGQLAVNAAIERGVEGRTFTYCIGHGEFLRADWLLRMRFPERQAIDDLPTGIALSLARMKIVPLPFFDFCTVPHGIFDFIRQTGTWFSACLDSAGPLELARTHFGPVSRVRAARLRAEQTISNLRWTIRGPVRAALLLAAILSASWPATALLVAIWTIESRLLWAVTARLLASHDGTEHLPRIPFRPSAILRAPLKSIGPCLHLMRRLRRTATTEYKTARA